MAAVMLTEMLDDHDDREERERFEPAPEARSMILMVSSAFSSAEAVSFSLWFIMQM